MISNEPPDDEVAAIDAVFQELPAAPIKPPPPANQPNVSVPATPPGGAAPRKTPQRDYLRELQQEFEEQENEGKL